MELTATQISAARYEFVRRDTRLTPLQRLVVQEVLDPDFATKGTEVRYRIWQASETTEKAEKG